MVGFHCRISDLGDHTLISSYSHVFSGDRDVVLTSWCNPGPRKWLSFYLQSIVTSSSSMSIWSPRRPLTKVLKGVYGFRCLLVQRVNRDGVDVYVSRLTCTTFGGTTPGPCVPDGYWFRHNLVVSCGNGGGVRTVSHCPSSSDNDRLPVLVPLCPNLPIDCRLCLFVRLLRGLRFIDSWYPIVCICSLTSGSLFSTFCSLVSTLFTLLSFFLFMVCVCFPF